MKVKTLNYEQANQLINEILHSRDCAHAEFVFNGTTFSSLRITNYSGKTIWVRFSSYNVTVETEDVETETVYHTRVKTFPSMCFQSTNKDECKKWEEAVVTTFKLDDSVFERAKEERQVSNVKPGEISPSDSINWS